MKLIDYHNSFLTDKPVYLPRVITDDYPAELLPEGNVPLARLADRCPVCGNQLWGTYKYKRREVKNVVCWNINCMWGDDETDANISSGNDDRNGGGKHSNRGVRGNLSGPRASEFVSC